MIWSWRICFNLLSLILSISVHYAQPYSDVANVEEFIQNGNENNSSREIINDYYYNANEETKESHNTLQQHTPHHSAANISENQIIIDMRQPKEISIYMRDLETTTAHTTASIGEALDKEKAEDKLDDDNKHMARENTAYITTQTSIPEYVGKGAYKVSNAQQMIPTDWQEEMNNSSHNSLNYDYEQKTHLSLRDKFAAIAEEIVPLALRLFSTQDEAKEANRNNESGETTAMVELSDETIEQEPTESNNKLNPPVAMSQHDLPSSKHDVTSRHTQQFISQNHSQDYDEYYEYENNEQFSPNYKQSVEDAKGRSSNVAKSINQQRPLQHLEQKQHQQPDNMFTHAPWTTLSPKIATKEDVFVDSTAVLTPSALSAITTTTTAAATQHAMSDKRSKHIPITSSENSGQHSSTSAITTTTTTTTTITTNKNNDSLGRSNNNNSNSNRRRLLAHEQLRNYIEDAYIRMPVAVIVDPSAHSLEKTKMLWNDALLNNINMKIILVALNGSGIPAAFSFNNVRQFLMGLNSIKERPGNGDAFLGILHASELVPYDSAIFISTGALPIHTDSVHDAAITLLKKRIRVYLLWYGERSLSENETHESVGGILGEVALRSGGEILHIMNSDEIQEAEGASTLTIVAEAFRGAQEIDIPVDTTLSSLHVKIDKHMKTATMDTANGEINLKKCVKFKYLNTLTRNDNDTRLYAYVPIPPKLYKPTTYKLKTIPFEMDTEYTVFIRAERRADIHLHDVIKRLEADIFTRGYSPYKNFKREHLPTKLNTAKTHDNIRFPEDLEYKPKADVETFSTKEIQGPTEVPKNSTVLNSEQKSINILQNLNTKIEIGWQSELFIKPGILSRLYFDITNTGLENLFYNIRVIDDKRFLNSLTPQSLVLRGGQMARILLTVFAPIGTEDGTTDHITLNAYAGGGKTTHLSVNLRVMHSGILEDITPPTVSWKFGSNCNIVSTNSNICSNHLWNAEITAQDSESGVIRLRTTPDTGLIYTSTFTVASTEPIKATYIASCCEPKIVLVAYDAAGNKRSFIIDAREDLLNEASIAAITLGVLLFVLLIVIIIAGIVWCCRKRKTVAVDFLSYSPSRGRTRN